jgi:hypothetical protein
MMFERVVEVDGMYVVAFASPTGVRGCEYLPQYKVFAQRPAGYFAPGCVLRGTRPSRHANVQEALDAAEAKARQEVMRLAARKT